MFKLAACPRWKAAAKVMPTQSADKHCAAVAFLLKFTVHLLAINGVQNT